MTKTMRERSLDAALAYMERVGFVLLDVVPEKDKAYFLDTALDGRSSGQDELVVLDVRTKDMESVRKIAQDGIPRRVIPHADLEDLEWLGEHADLVVDSIRYDTIVILPVGSDRALLRHERATSGPFEEWAS